MNSVQISGNLTADIEALTLGEQTVCKFNLACNQGKRTVFMPVEAWNQAHLPAYLGKGSKVLVGGHLKQETWQTKSGENRHRIIVTANSVEFLDPKPRGDESTPGGRKVAQTATAG